MRKLFNLIVLILSFIFFILWINSLMFHSKQLPIVSKKALNLTTDSSALNHLSEAIKFRTHSSQPDSLQVLLLDSFQLFLQKKFPLLHWHLKRRKIGHSLLYTWYGKDTLVSSCLFMAHQDVVPVPDTLNWDSPPFDGKISGKYLYGRGSMDDKSSMMGMMEAIESLLKNNFRPSGNIYLAFGQDEETGGHAGAAKIASWMESHNIKTEFILDEGGYILKGVVPGIEKAVALVGIAEKGYLSLQITADGEGGHTSMPPEETSIDKLSKAIVRLKSEAFKANLPAPMEAMFDYLGPEMNFGQKLVFANRWLFKPMILSSLEKKNSTNASIRTTVATSMFQAGIKDNVLPEKAEAVINFRILPGQTFQKVIENVKEIIKDSSLEVSKYGDANNPSPISDTASAGFRKIQKSISEIFPEVLAAPFMVISTSDTKHFNNISKNIFRFIPMRLNADDLHRFHGKNERIQLENYMEIIEFYKNLIRRN